jgi:DNA-binding Lrp family transcriptional regulator
MTTLAPTAFTNLEFALLNRFQRDFPLVQRPYAALAQQLETSESCVIEHLRRLRNSGVISRVGAVFRPNAIGASALAALAVPADRLEEVAACVSATPEVNHNYAREHRFNLWFVVTAASPQRLRQVLQQIEQASQCGAALVLPLIEDYHIDLGFDLSPATNDSFAFGARTAPTSERSAHPVALGTSEHTLIAALQDGLPLVPQPFAALGLPQAQALALLAHWLDEGVIKRLGVIVRHHELGYRANAMVVWDVPDERVSEIGRRIAATGRVTLCYRRNRQLPDWPYNLFCMIHGKDHADVKARIAALAGICQLQAHPSEILFSVRRFKQRGAHYAAALETVHG